MKIKHIKVGCNRYSVEAIPPEEMEKSNTIGQIGLYTGKIVIDGSHTKQSQAQVLMHEILHALFMDSGLSLSNRKEERIIEALSPRLTAFLADNPTQVRELLKALTVKEKKA